MHTEEFVLIPCQMDTKKQPQVSQLLTNKNVADKAKQISLPQRNNSPSPPSVAQQDMEQQTDVDVREEETSEEKTDAKKKIKVGKRILGNIKYFKGTKLGEATQILDNILKSEFFCFDTMKRFIIYEPFTKLPDVDFPYDLQQPTTKTTIDHFRVFALLDISSHLTSNTFAKDFLLLSPEEIFTVFEDDQSEYEDTSIRIQRDQKTKAASNDESSVKKEEIEPPGSTKNYFSRRYA